MKRNLLLTLALGGSLAAMAAAPYTPPYSYDFNSGLGEFTTLDSNNDGKTFKHTSYGGHNWSAPAYYDGTGVQGSADDWLFTPELTLKSGLVYEMSFWYRNLSTGKNNKLEVKAGNTKTAEGMTINVLDVFDITSNEWMQKTIRFSVEAVGNYYVGFHAVSVGDQSYLYLDDVSIAAGVNPLAPNAPTAQTPTFNVNGSALEAQISITAPTTTFTGDFLSGNVTLNIKRADKETPETLTAAPGATVTYTDTNALLTATSYDITCTANGAESQVTTVQANPVLGTPKPVQNFTAAQDGNVFTLTWDAVTEPINASDLFVPSSVTYNVKCGNVTVAENLAATTTNYTYPMPAEGQDVVNFSITAKHSDKTSDATNAGPYIVGNPLAGAFTESFANYAYTNSGWSTDVSSSRGWKLLSTDPNNNINPQDGDGGFIRFSDDFNATQKLCSPVLDLSSLANPKLKFWVNIQTTKDHLATIQPGFVINGVETLLGEPINVRSGETDGWKEFTFSVPESATTAPTQIVFVGKGNGGYNYIYMDNINIRGYLAHDLAVEVVAPANSLNIGQEASFAANVSNVGSNAESDYSVSLYAGEDLVTTIEGVEIPADGMISVALPFKALPKYAAQDVDFRVEVTLANDGDNTNNEATVTVPVLTNELVAPTDLTATSTTQNVQLSWAAPVVSSEPVSEEVTESFESWTTGSTEAEAGWTFINDDVFMRGVNKQLAGEKFTAMVSEGFPGAYNWNPAFAPYDGNKGLVICPSESWGVTLDKWFISPEVKGGTDLTFYAQSLSEYTTRSYSVVILWSTGGTAKEDFTELETKSIQANSWVECTATLPADARRFAIRFNGTINSEDYLAFDKFTFTSYTAPAVLSGYNLYRDDAFVATLPVDVTSYADAEAQPDVTHTYNVTAVYDKGESLYSEAATGSRGTSVGIEGIDSDLEDAQYYTLDGLRIDKPAKGQIVIVRRGNKVSKMIVK